MRKDKTRHTHKKNEENPTKSKGRKKEENASGLLSNKCFIYKYSRVRVYIEEVEQKKPLFCVLVCSTH